MGIFFSRQRWAASASPPSSSSLLSTPPAQMASLTIRNLTITPLELKLVERFAGEPVLYGPGVRSSNFTGFFNGTSASKQLHHQQVVVPQGAEPTAQQDVSGIAVAPFSTHTTDIPAAAPEHEVLRLTFEKPGTPGHRYVVDAPGPSPRSLVMRRVDSDGKDDDDDDDEFTAVYVPQGAVLAIFSSAKLSQWMAELSSEYPLSALSIPGTHNSPTHHVALPSVRCQAVSVREQLDNGVRFLDVRVSTPSDGDGALALVHSAFPVSLTGTKWFADLLAEVYAFLDARPSETVLMSIKREGTGRGSDQQLSRYLAGRYCAGEDTRRWYTEPRVPTLGEVRGRIVLVRRFGLDDGLRADHHGGAGWGIDASAWPDNCADGTCGSGLIRIQDFYEVDQSTNIEKKITFAHAQLERAAQQLFAVPRALASGGNPGPDGNGQMSSLPPPPPVFVNFLSASNFFNASCWPEKIAAKVNPAVIDYLCTRHGEPEKGPSKLPIGDAATGVVVTDWVGLHGDWDLIRCIVGWNARLQLK